MGCGSSKKVSESSAGLKTFAMDAFNSAASAADSAEVIAPESPEGAAQQSQMEEKFESLSNSITSAINVSEAGFAECVNIVAQSGYTTTLGESFSPLRQYSCGWMEFQYPDNGQWKIGMDNKSGCVTMKSANNVLGISITFSMGTMRSEVDSEGFANMFQDKLRSVFARDYVVMMNGKMTMLKQMTQPVAISVSGNSFCEWTQDMTIVIGTQHLAGRQLEVHGMRVEPTDSERKSHFYGFNISAVCPSVQVYDKMEKLFRQIISTVRYRSADECEEALGTFWDAIGR